ncbi:hypothetical protein DFH05DRAFT_214509 [Lentinula detonsa]|uniref:Uncharacterized protein n=1 Tax=Lentinula detonsa TaxID=2804962 RepID=A0A9W8NX89_9AGAR|nr:hypothetical protein DFH05DRAFT_214509 [Lentinula detonsa]
MISVSSIKPHIENVQNTDATTYGYIDDEDGDPVTGVFPTFSPQTGWTQGSVCTDCAFHPDSTKAFNGTWSDTTHYISDPARTVQFNFTGTSLDVFCILPNPSDPDLTSVYNLTFNLDGQPLQQTFTHRTDLSNNFVYNASVLSLEGLTSTSHVFTMLAASTDVNSSLLFDYARYSNIVDPSPSLSSTAPVQTQSSSTANVPTTRTSSLPIIIGVVLGSIILFLLVIVLFLYRRYKQIRPQSTLTPPNGIEPFAFHQLTPSMSSRIFPIRNPEQNSPDSIEPPSYAKIDSM